MNPNQPDEFFPFLAECVSAGGPWRCGGVDCAPDGSLTFQLEQNNKKIDAVWSVAARIDGGTPFRDGAIAARTKSRGAAAVVEAQLAARLAELFKTGAPLLIEKRNRDVELIFLGPGILRDLFHSLLVPGRTARAGFIFAGAAMEGAALKLVFQTPGENLALLIAPAGAGGRRRIVGRYGPLELLAPTARPTEPALRIERFIGYILALGTSDSMRIASSVETAARSQPNTFFFDESLDEINLFNAMFACRGRLATVAHFDRECTHYFSYFNGPAETFNLWPWKIRPSLDYQRTYRFTDMNDMDTIMTGGERRFEALAREIASARPRPQLLFVIDSCVSKIIGDDIDAPLAELAGELDGIPVVRMEVTLGPPENFRRLWRDLIALFQKPARGGGGATVNLIGFGPPDACDTAEIRLLLESAGVSVAAAMLPSFDLDELPRLGDAAINVMHPSEQVRDAFSYAAPLCRAPIAAPPAPYGITGTRDWLNATLRECGAAPLAPARMNELADPAAAEWETLVRDAGEFSAAVILMADHFSREPDPLKRRGIPWLACMDEMGFALEILVVKTGPEPPLADPEFARLMSSFSRPDAHRLIPVEADHMLPALLNESRAALLYSERWRDRRVTGTGKIPFSLTDFEMGFAGAARTLRKLLALCRTPFHRRYKRFFGIEAPRS